MKKLIVFFILLCLPCMSFAKTGKCTRVIDGDTLVVVKENKEIKIRLYGIDCPELDQPYGEAARQYISNFVLDKTIRYVETGTDRYKRTVAIVYISNTDISLQESLLKSGLAWIYPLYCTESICKEWERVWKDAILHGKGMWLTPPWLWRKNIEKGSNQQ